MDVHTNAVTISRDVRFNEDADDIFLRDSVDKRTKDSFDMKIKEQEIPQEIIIDHQEDKDVMEETVEETEHDEEQNHNR